MSTSSYSSFDTTFQRLKRRVFAIGGMSGAAWGCCGALVLLLVGIWMDLVWELSPESRIGAWTLSMGAGLVLLTAFLMNAGKSARRAMIARQLDDTGNTGGTIVSGFELQSRSVTTTASLTQGLTQMAIANAASLAALIPSTLAVPSKPARQAGLAALTAFVGFGLFAFFAPNLAYTEWRRFADPFGDHPPYSPTQFHVEPGNTQVRYGDGLDVNVTVEGPTIDDLELILRTTADGKTQRVEKLPMFSDSLGHWRATVSAITLPGQYFVQARSTRSRRFSIDVITVPLIESVRFRITPPAYTRDAVYEGPLPQGGISALAGAKIEVFAKSNRPLQGGAVEVVSGDQRETVSLLPATTDGTSHEVHGSWTVAKAGSFHLSVTDVAGQASRDSFSGTINLLVDHIPLVRILEPPPKSLATPSVTLPVTISAEDDYGVTRLQLYRSLNDSRSMPVVIELPLPPPRRYEQSVQLPLSAYGLQPGDVIKLFARVEDNDPAGAKGSESAVVVIQIVSDEELERLIHSREGVDELVAKYQEAQRRLESLQEEVEQLQKKLEKRDADGELSKEGREQIEQLAKRAEEEAKAVRELAKHLLPYDLDKSLNDELEKLAKKMDEAGQEAKDAAAKPNAGQAASKLAKLGEKLDQEKKAMKEGINDPLEKLAEIYPLMEDQNRFLELYYRQRDLADRLTSLKNQENPNDPAIKTRMRELESEQRKIREDLDELLNDIETHAQRLPDDDPDLQGLAKSSLEFVAAVRASGADTAMSDAELGLSEFSGKRGHAEAKNAADILEEFLSRCKECEGEGEGACKGLKFSPGEGSMGDTLSQLLAGAGFKPGNKSGQNGPMGSGGGYSARRGAMNNIGLYGQRPTRGNPTAAKSGSGKKAKSAAGGSFSASDDRETSSRIDPHGLLKSSGVSETAVPARYRGRVQEYFQRIAEEAGEKKK